MSAPPPREIASYSDQALFTGELISSMERIEQTIVQGYQWGPKGHHAVLVIRTDHIGRIRRCVVSVLFKVIGWMSRPHPRWPDGDAREDETMSRAAGSLTVRQG